jgi:hypothetical protein
MFDFHGIKIFWACPGVDSLRCTPASNPGRAIRYKPRRRSGGSPQHKLQWRRGLSAAIPHARYFHILNFIFFGVGFIDVRKVRGRDFMLCDIISYIRFLTFSDRY